MIGPIKDKIIGLRQRKRVDGTWRIWWEPGEAARDLGFAPVELDEKRLTWSKREAERLNKDVNVARVTGSRPARSGGNRTMDALIHAYRNSRSFKSKAPKTQQSYNSNLKIIAGRWGNDLVIEFTKPILAVWYDANFDERGPSQAISLNRTMSILFQFAELQGWRPENSNPARNINAAVPKGRSRRLSWAESDALIAAARDLGRHAVALAIGMSLYQGQRQTDVRLARVQDFKWITQVQENEMKRILIWVLERSKRATAGAMPIHEEILADLSSRVLQDIAPETFILIDEATGKPYDQDLISSRFAQIRAHAMASMPSLHDVQFRDLRRTFGKRARAGGATKDDTADVLGNSAANNFQLSEVYMATQFDTASRAVDATRRPKEEEAQ